MSNKCTTVSKNCDEGQYLFNLRKKHSMVVKS